MGKGKSHFIHHIQILYHRIVPSLEKEVGRRRKKLFHVRYRKILVRIITKFKIMGQPKFTNAYPHKVIFIRTKYFLTQKH